MYVKKEAKAVNRLREVLESEQREYDSLARQQGAIEQALAIHKAVISRLEKIVNSSGNGSSSASRSAARPAPVDGRRKVTKTGKEWAIEVLTEAGKPMRNIDIIKAVAERSGIPEKVVCERVSQAVLLGLKGNKPVFRRVDIGVYTLAK